MKSNPTERLSSQPCLSFKMLYIHLTVATVFPSHSSSSLWTKIYRTFPEKQQTLCAFLFALRLEQTTVSLTTKKKTLQSQSVHGSYGNTLITIFVSGNTNVQKSHRALSTAALGCDQSQAMNSKLKYHTGMYYTMHL